MFLTVFLARLNSRQISRIALPSLKCACRTLRIVSTFSISLNIHSHRIMRVWRMVLRWVNFGRRFRIKVGHCCTPIHSPDQRKERIGSIYPLPKSSTRILKSNNGKSPQAGSTGLQYVKELNHIYRCRSGLLWRTILNQSGTEPETKSSGNAVQTGFNTRRNPNNMNKQIWILTMRLLRRCPLFPAFIPSDGSCDCWHSPELQYCLRPIQLYGSVYTRGVIGCALDMTPSGKNPELICNMRGKYYYNGVYSICYISVITT